LFVSVDIDGNGVRNNLVDSITCYSGENRKENAIDLEGVRVCSLTPYFCYIVAVSFTRRKPPICH